MASAMAMSHCSGRFILLEDCWMDELIGINQADWQTSGLASKILICSS